MTRSPLPALKAGGIGTREVARVAKALGIDGRRWSGWPWS